MKNKELPVTLLPGEITWGLRYLLFQLVFLGPIISSVLSLFSPHIRGIHIDTVYFLVNFGAVLGIFHRYLGKSVQNGLRHWRKLLLTAGAGLIVYFILTQGLDLLITRFYPEFQNINDTSISRYTKEQFWLTAFGTVILVPMTEETLFRGLIFGFLHRKSRVLAYVICTLFFAFIHVMGYLGTAPAGVLALCFVQYLPAGLILAFVYEYSGSILSPILIHTAVNASAIISMR